MEEKMPTRLRPTFVTAFTAFLALAVFPPSAAAGPVVPIAELIDQLNGKHCDYIRTGIDATAKCELYKPTFREKLGRLVTASSDLTDCDCRGRAAECISISPDAMRAVPNLIDYLRSGPRDYEGDGTSWCLSNVIIALGQIGEERAIYPLVDFLNKPRAADPTGNPSGTTKDWFAVIKAAVALAQFGRQAEAAIEPLTRLIEKGPPPLNSSSREFLLAALGEIPSPKALVALEQELKRFASILEQEPMYESGSSFLTEGYNFPNALAAVQAAKKQKAAGTDISSLVPSLRTLTETLSRRKGVWIAAERLSWAPISETVQKIEEELAALRLPIHPGSKISAKYSWHRSDYPREIRTALHSAPMPVKAEG